MTEDSQYPAEDRPAIVKVQAAPRRDQDGKISRREVLTFASVWELVGKKLRQGGELTEEYVRAKVAQETNAASKAAEEAGELASKRELNEADTDVTRQKAAGEFIKNLKEVDSLSGKSQLLALAKIMQENPDIAAQLEQIESTLDTLRNVRGLIADSSPEEAVAALPADQSEDA